MHRTLLPVALLALLISVPIQAKAKCMSPSTTFANAQGADAPLSGETYLFVVRGDIAPGDVRATLSGKSVPIKVTRSAGGPEYKVLRVSWRSLAPGVLRIKATPPKKKPYYGAATTELNLKRGWRPSATPPKLGAAWVGPPTANVSEWTCSYSQVQQFPLSLKAFAYRVTFETADGPESQIFPANIHRLFGYEDKEPLLSLGHVSCFGETFAHRDAASFDIEALALDGTTMAAARGLKVTYPRSKFSRGQ